MERMEVLVSGAGIAGYTVAYWLTRNGHSVTVVERGRSEQESVVREIRPLRLRLASLERRHVVRACRLPPRGAPRARSGFIPPLDQSIVPRHRIEMDGA
jgi:2-polyprenyl-6-methoxyphenol hydroxylase-like FAD-dependent oxidoreductase